MFFYVQSYSESVPQDLPSGREVMRISATDIDDGNNSIVHYSLDTNSPDQAYFYIDPDNGVIFLNKTIDVSIQQLNKMLLEFDRLATCHY